MTDARSLIDQIESGGGQLFLVSNRLTIYPKELAASMIDELRQHKEEIVRLLLADSGLPPMAPQDDGPDNLDRFRPGFVQWFDQNIQIDAEWLARLGPAPRWCAGLNALHRHCSAWLIEKERAAQAALTEFEALLLELGCAIHGVGGKRLVSGMALREDIAAQRDFPAVKPEPPKPTEPASSSSGGEPDLDPKTAPEEIRV